jgi:hypothetical protein
MITKMVIIASVLMGFGCFTPQIHAAPQEAGPHIKQKVSQKAEEAAAQSRVFYQGVPHFVSIEGTLITYATNTRQTVLRIGDTFYFLLSYFEPYFRLTEGGTRNVWLVSKKAQGPWVVAEFIPEETTAIVCAQINADPSYPYQLCALPWPS